MCKNNKYIKTNAQIAVEQLAYELIDKNLTVTLLKNINKRLKDYETQHYDRMDVSAKERAHESIYAEFGCSWQDAVAYSELLQRFNNLISSCIIEIANENKTHTSINRLAKDHGAKYDPELREYDTYFDVISSTFDGLYHIITKKENKGRLRIDTYLDKPDELYIRLRSYMQRNIIMDTARSFNTHRKYVEEATSIFEDGNELYKDDLDPKHAWEDFTADAAIEKYDSSIKTDLIEDILERFSSRKAVAAYLYVQLLLHKYDKKKVINELTRNEFFILFKDALQELEAEYDIDLSYYKAKRLNTERYLASFRCATERTKQDRIDRLLSDTKKEVRLLSSYKRIQDTYNIRRGHYFTL